ncbi:MAG TPA: hypothetical protein PLT65_01840 [Bacilli bacterium]|nr:hypothetical protein [Bacilli bacterium]
MKKYLVLLVAFACLFITGCGSTTGGGGILSSSKNITCTKTSTEDDIKTAETITTTFKGDKLIYFKGHTVMSFVDSETATMMYFYIGMSKSVLEGYGFTVATEQKESDIIVNYEGDMVAISKNIEANDNSEFQYTEETTLESFEESMVADGYTCK